MLERGVQFEHSDVVKQGGEVSFLQPMYIEAESAAERFAAAATFTPWPESYPRCE